MDSFVYRLETDAGDGIFQSGLLDDIQWLYCDDDNYPSPRHDRQIQRNMRWNHRCGVATPAMLQHWFMPAVDILIPSRAKIRVYEVPVSHIIYGEFQVLFDVHHARKVKEFPIDILPVLQDFI